ncbi:4-alpha-glucanotransferase [Glaciecola sp. 1036]|uniref:4-alpha-glucanotransferase n=1 Tax=Alteromonadaceae TaxID=72275 RepID=UPI003CFC7D35
MTDYLQKLVEHKGLGSEFVDAWGKPAKIARENQLRILQAMGYDLTTPESISAQLIAEAETEWLTQLNPVYVLRKEKLLSFSVRVSIDNAAKAHNFKIITEKNDKLNVKFVPVDHELVATTEIDGIEYQQYLVSIEQILPLGYHQLELHLGRKKLTESKLILAPATCYIPPEIKKGRKLWGLSVQLYCLKSQRNWGIGDFSDLITLVKESAERGADFIGLNPIHALYPANPDACSPYGPSSRRWLNYLYIDVEKVPGFDDVKVHDFMQQNDYSAKLSHLRATEFVDYAGVAEAKLPALECVFDCFSQKYLVKNTKYKKAFDKFVQEGGDSLHNLAVFEALQMDLKQQGKPHWGWPVFPENLKNAQSSAVKRFAKKAEHQVLFYKFLQWQAFEQFCLASKVAEDAGMLVGLYRDLAVGVSDGSAEIWGNKDLYCTQVSVGAPPDILGPLGQKWGLPPMDPDVLYQQAYGPIIELFSANMQASGALRIDHVMALLRLWWVHNSDTADKGVYVNYPVDDLLAILALESQRNKALVIGEDLGTVPDAIRDKLAANGVYSYRVFFFEQAEDGGFYSPSHYPVQSMATLTTHDMPTLSGFWHCDDFVLGKEVGVYPDDEVLAELYDDRHEMKQQILDSLHGHGSIPDYISRDVNYVGMTKELNFGMQTHMASGSSALLSLQLEDWLQMDKPVNIPGTFNEYPNWRRKLSKNLEDIFSQPEIQHLASELTQKRRQASK